MGLCWLEKSLSIYQFIPVECLNKMSPFAGNFQNEHMSNTFKCHSSFSPRADFSTYHAQVKADLLKK